MAEELSAALRGLHKALEAAAQGYVVTAGSGKISAPFCQVRNGQGLRENVFLGMEIVTHR